MVRFGLVRIVKVGLEYVLNLVKVQLLYYNHLPIVPENEHYISLGSQFMYISLVSAFDYQ